MGAGRVVVVQLQGEAKVRWTLSGLDEGGNQEALSVPVPYGISPIPGDPRRSSRKLYREGNSTCQNELKEGGVWGLLGWIGWSLLFSLV